MSSKVKAAPPSPARSVRRDHTAAARRRRRRRGGTSLLAWAGIAGVVLVLMLISLWQTGAFAKPAPASRTENPADLLPLAAAVRPLSGGHDMARIPPATPAPKPAPAGAALPAVDLPSVSYDFGRIAKRPDVQHVFAVQNTGSVDLVLSNLVTSCGCTTARTSTSVIPPGQRADLTVTFDPDFHPIKGETTRLVWFATNDPTQPWIELRITADVEP